MKRVRVASVLGAVLSAVIVSGAVVSVAMAHGNVTPQPVATEGLPNLGPDWLKSNPFRGNPRAIEIGADAFNQNCARCHGLEAKSGGIAPDLRYLEPGDSGDEWFSYRVNNGSVRDGRVYMPKFYPTLSQEALWSIRSWLETVHADN